MTMLTRNQFNNLPNRTNCPICNNVLHSVMYGHHYYYTCPCNKFIMGANKTHAAFIISNIYYFFYPNLNHFQTYKLYNSAFHPNKPFYIDFSFDSFQDAYIKLSKFISFQ